MIKERTIDATGKSLGRVASEAAKALMGKIAADYTPHICSEVKVTIVNVAKLRMSMKKRARKVYKTYSGYPGGQRVESFNQLSARRAFGEPLRRAVARMLPRNSFHKARLRNLIISK